jgi:DNA-binding transcriptional ArsR family regulator
MVEDATVDVAVMDAAVMDAVFHALANDTRRTMLERLAEHQLTVGELAEPLEMSLAAAAKHVTVLERAGLIRKSARGRQHVCRLDPAALASADAWLRFYERHWNRRLDALETLYRTEPESAAKDG